MGFSNSYALFTLARLPRFVASHVRCPSQTLTLTIVTACFYADDVSQERGHFQHCFPPPSSLPPPTQTLSTRFEAAGRSRSPTPLDRLNPVCFRRSGGGE